MESFLTVFWKRNQTSDITRTRSQDGVLRQAGVEVRHAVNMNAFSSTERARSVFVWVSLWGPTDLKMLRGRLWKWGRSVQFSLSKACWFWCGFWAQIRSWFMCWDCYVLVWVPRKLQARVCVCVCVCVGLWVIRWETDSGSVCLWSLALWLSLFLQL